MTDKTLPPTDAALRALLADIDAGAGSIIGPHLDDDEVVRYAAGQIPRERVLVIERHAASCDRCALALEQLLGVVEAWQGAAGEERLERLRVRLRDVQAATASAAKPVAGTSDHPGRLLLAEYLAGESTERDAIREHVEGDNCVECADTLASGTVEALACVVGLRAKAREVFSAVWDALLFRSPDLRTSKMNLASVAAAALAAQPSSLHFGGEQPDAVPEWGTIFTAPPAVNAISELYTSNGRALPDEAEVFWGHEIWLVQLPVSIVPRPGIAVESVGVRMRFLDERVDVLDVLPRCVVPATGESREARRRLAFADLRWNGRTAPADQALPLADEVRVLGGGATIRLATGAGFVGRIAIPLLAARVQSAIVGLGDASVIFEPDTPFAAGLGCVCAVVLTDKHVDQITVEVRVWLTARVVNDVPARAACHRIEFQVRLTGGEPFSSPGPSQA